MKQKGCPSELLWRLYLANWMQRARPPGKKQRQAKPPWARWKSSTHMHDELYGSFLLRPSPSLSSLYSSCLRVYSFIPPLADCVCLNAHQFVWKYQLADLCAELPLLIFPFLYFPFLLFPLATFPFLSFTLISFTFHNLYLHLVIFPSYAVQSLPFFSFPLIIFRSSPFLFSAIIIFSFLSSSIHSPSSPVVIFPLTIFTSQ